MAKRTVVVKYEIENSVPMPCKGKYPWEHMRVGDSITVNMADYTKARSSATMYQKKFKGTKFAIRKQDVQTARIWRVA